MLKRSTVSVFEVGSGFTVMLGVSHCMFALRLTMPVPGPYLDMIYLLSAVTMTTGNIY